MTNLFKVLSVFTILSVVISCNSDDAKCDSSTQVCSDQTPKTVPTRSLQKTNYVLTLNESRNIVHEISIEVPQEYAQVTFNLSNSYFSNNVIVYKSKGWQMESLNSNNDFVVPRINGRVQFRLPISKKSDIEKLQNKEIRLSMKNGATLHTESGQKDHIDLSLFSHTDIKTDNKNLQKEQLAIYHLATNGKLQLSSFRNNMTSIQNRSDLEPYKLALDLSRMQQVYGYMKTLLPKSTNQFIRQLDVLYSAKTLGYVVPVGSSSNRENWTMGINLLHAFSASNINSTSFNFPAFELTMLHEFTHIWTFQTNQMENLVDDKTKCNNHFTNQYGCQKSSSYLNLFAKKYWPNNSSSSYIDSPNSYVSPYAASSAEEDIAETTSFMLAESQISSVQQSNVTRLQKTAMMYNMSFFKALYNDLPQRLKVIRYGKVTKREFQKVLLESDPFFETHYPTNCLSFKHRTHRH